MRRLALFVFLIASIQPVLAADFGGVWVGECNDCAATKFILKLTRSETDLSGTIQIDGTNSFGDGEKKLDTVEAEGRKIEFTVYGDSGDLFEVELKISADGKSLTGDGYYGSGNFGLTFER